MNKKGIETHRWGYYIKADNKKSTSAAKTESVKKVTLPKVDQKKVIQLNEGVNPKKQNKDE